MCSVSLLPRDDGFVLAMNRDESLSRVSALPPEVLGRDGLSMLCPRELSGGTWIGVNSAGMAFSLINWYSQPDCAFGNPVSRGQVVRALLSARSQAAAASLLRELPLQRMNPFRLMVVSSSERSLTEWRSGGGDLEPFDLPWKRHHWFSSALDEGKANRIRRRVCARIDDDLDLPSLRKLHRSHAPKAGPFSLCMHRKDACTVSYTEINVRGPMATTYYIAGPPCSKSLRFKASLDLDVAAVLRKVA
jgi:hypothetical protein